MGAVTLRYSCSFVLCLSFYISIGSAAATDALSDAAPWPICRDAVQHFCIEDFSQNGVSVFTNSEAATIGEVPIRVEAHFVDTDTIAWSVSGGATKLLPSAARDSYLQIRLRTGALYPAFTHAVAERFHSHTDGGVETGYILVLEGVPTAVNWLVGSVPSCEVDHCGDTKTAANTEGWVFSGVTSNASAWTPEQRQRLSGAYIASNAQRLSGLPVLDPDLNAQWSLQLANPHLGVDGLPSQGSFSAFLPSGYFEAMGSDAQLAKTAGLSVVQVTGGSRSVLVGALTVLDQGVYFRVPHLAFSTVHLIGGDLGDAFDTTMVPDPPILKAATVRPGTVDLTFIPPRFDGGATITHYQARCSQGVETFSVTVTARDRTASVSGLRGTEPTACTVFAMNRVGKSLSSNGRRVVPPGARAPSPPIKLQLSSERNGVGLHFEAPVNDGGSTLTGFIVRCWQGDTRLLNVQLAADEFNKFLQPFVSGEAVSCVVAAKNAVGQSEPTASLSAVPWDSSMEDEENLPTASKDHLTQFVNRWTLMHKKRISKGCPQVHLCIRHVVRPERKRLGRLTRFAISRSAVVRRKPSRAKYQAN